MFVLYTSVLANDFAMKNLAQSHEFWSENVCMNMLLRQANMKDYCVKLCEVSDFVIIIYCMAFCFGNVMTSSFFAIKDEYVIFRSVVMLLRPLDLIGLSLSV